MAAQEIVDQCANLTLADVEDEDLAVRVPYVPDANEPAEEGFFAVGRVLTNRAVRFAYFQDTMAGVWQAAMGVNMRELQPRRFLFRFYHKADLLRILSEGPWAYEQSLLVMKRLELGEDPEIVQLDHAEFWVQIHALPIGFRSESVVNAIGSFLGRVVQADERNFDGSLRTYYRIRVSLDITKALKKQMKLKQGVGSWAIIDFRYERLPTFCFLCGLIGHGDRHCRLALERHDPKAKKPYGAWLRATSRREPPLVNMGWIPPETAAERKSWKSSAMGGEAGYSGVVGGFWAVGWLRKRAVGVMWDEAVRVLWGMAV
ncbi:PREDICTED: uncharacterized protein LOC109163565 [Ipomoea nil]|uniref:uncharacterized protein LOC109163565 n=1 Tax=Ipomoea nil TaxID=35883 RepID=UPI0009015507|nr:PREDICTED: uncharacterized protein LOC109163565 [Ipomoea nil]